VLDERCGNALEERMRDDVKDLLDRAAGWYEPPPVGPDELVRRHGRRQRVGRVTTAVVALAVFAIAGALLWTGFEPVRRTPGTLAGSNILDVPPRGKADAAFLADGRPVWVVHTRDGSITVVDGFSPHRAWGISQLLLWCPANYFASWPDGSYFDRYGTWRGGRPAPPGLASFGFDVLRRDAVGDPVEVRVGAIGPPIPSGHASITSQRADPTACGSVTASPERFIGHAIDPSRIWDSPVDTANDTTEEWMAVQGTLLVTSGGSVRMCSDIVASICREGVPVRGVDAAGLRKKIESNPDVAYARPHVWLVRVDDGAIVELAIGDQR
jgi:hypothetical protein